MEFAACTRNTDTADAGPYVDFGGINTSTSHDAFRHLRQQIQLFNKYSTSMQ